MDWTYSRVPSDLDLKKKKIHREKTKRKLNECIEPICLVDMIPKPEFLQKNKFLLNPTVWNVSYEKKPSYFPLYWLVYRDPYIGLWKNPHIIG